AKSIATGTVTTKETVDVYSVATGANGQRSMVCDLDSTDPEGWENDKHVITEDQSDASIWEIHVKDFSYAENSGVSKDNRGKFLAFTETGTTLNGEGDVSTCIDYLKELGVTYVQINPFYDFGSVDETGSDSQFNWGYDPMNYNVPEGSYSTDPYNGNTRIKECKQMIQALHNAGIGVIMDVVYNHTYNTSTSFQACVPDYYYRKTASGAFSSGSGCGNDTASERAMYRNFMVQSTKYWAEEYHVDGFRFDLMGLHDNATMNAIRESLDTIDEGIIMYGEGWSMSSTHDEVDCDGNAVVMCNQTSTKLIDPRIAMFNDQFRDSMKGSFSAATAKGFVQGNIVGNSKGVKYGFRANAIGGSCNWKAMNPGQCVNYMSCHDNNTLYDKLGVSVNGANNVVYRQRDDYLIKLNKFAETIAATSQGMHFMLAGEEMARSKDGDDNSYKSAATENMIDWQEIVKNADLVSYYRGMMDIRKAFSPFTTDDVEVSKNQYKISSALTLDDRAFAFTISNTV
ncbi:MAG: type I pullulanase, partial [Ruminococcus sp.]